MEAFLHANPVEDNAAQALRFAHPAVQSAVVARGSLATAHNPTGALFGRLLRAEAQFRSQAAPRRRSRSPTRESRSRSRSRLVRRVARRR